MLADRRARPGAPTGGHELAHAIADELAPRTSAYFQVFLSDDEGRNVAPMNSDEPLYGPHYLPRKFKIGIAHPDDNSIDVLTQDVGFVPVASDGRADGSLWDLYSGGGLGLTHNKPQTAPLLGCYLGRIRREQVVDAARAIAILQKEHGERKDRRQARWKYTIRRLGLDAVRAGAEVALPARARERAAGAAAADAAPPRLARAGRRHELVRDLDRERAAHAARCGAPCARAVESSAWACG